MEDFFELSRRGFKGMEEMSVMFRKFYGLDNMEKNTADCMKAWEKNSAEFQESFKQFLAMFGVVPKEEYISLVKKYEELKKRVGDQEETIRHLQLLLGEKSADQGETVKVFQSLIEKQSEQFMEMMNAVGQYFQEQNKDQSQTGKV